MHIVPSRSLEQFRPGGSCKQIVGWTLAAGAHIYIRRIAAGTILRIFPQKIDRNAFHDPVRRLLILEEGVGTR